MPIDIDYRRLLQGRYEAERLPQDFSPERKVPDFAFNILNPLGLLYRPVADENYLAHGGHKPAWPEGKPFAVCLTHDVDKVSLYSFRQSARQRYYNCMHGGFLKDRFRACLGLGLDLVRAIRYSTTHDPLHCYEQWLEVEKRFNARSTFFFWPGWSNVGKHHRTDCTYELTDPITFEGQACTVAEMIREIDHRGWEIGLHPSWSTFDNVEEMKRQKAALEAALGKDVVSVRQHYLHYDIRVTPRIQAAAGLHYDSTLGFNDNIGFRFGTSYPWRLYDLQAESELPITEIPLIIQDGAMYDHRKGLRLDTDMAMHYIDLIASAVERVGGVLTLLWHPHAILRPKWWHLYQDALAYLQEKNAYYCRIRDIAVVDPRE